MSGTIGDNVYRASGVVAAASAGISWQSVTTGSTLTAVAGNGYPIDTTSNACTITLPASASVGDEIVFTDYDRTWGTNAITIDSNGLNYQGDDDTFNVEYTTTGQSVHIVYMDATNGWIPISDDDVADVPTKGNQEGVFGYGDTMPGLADVTNLISNTGVISADVSGLGTARQQPGACEYDGDKGIFGFGQTAVGKVSITNLVSNVGVVAADQAATTGTARNAPGALEFGGDKGIFAFGSASVTAVSNLVSNAGVVASDVTGVGTARRAVGACEYGDDKGIMAFGYDGSVTNVSNLISNVGVVATDQAATTGTAREYVSACGYDYDKGIFSFGGGGGATNLISNAGVVATDVTQVGTAKHGASSCEYGGSKGIFGLGSAGGTNLVSNAGVVATDTSYVAGVTARYVAGACSFN